MTLGSYLNISNRSIIINLPRFSCFFEVEPAQRQLLLSHCNFKEIVEIRSSDNSCRCSNAKCTAAKFDSGSKLILFFSLPPAPSLHLRISFLQFLLNDKRSCPLWSGIPLLRSRDEPKTFGNTEESAPIRENVSDPSPQTRLCGANVGFLIHTHQKTTHSHNAYGSSRA